MATLNNKIILIVDDDIKIVQLLKQYFENEGAKTITAYDGKTALKLIVINKPDLIILDIMLPDIDGLEICKQVQYKIPILMLSARSEEVDKLIGLEIGADDYITKPFSPREVIARVKAILRRVKGDKLSDDKFKIAVIRRGSLLIDIESHIVTIDDKVIDLTPTEFKILEMLSKNAGRVFSRSKIVEQIQGYEFEGYERTIDVHVKNLRRKLSEYSQDKNLIVTVHGLGYKFMES